MMPGAGVAPPPMPTPAWHIAEAGASVGPFSSEQLAQAVAASRVTRETLVWSAGMSEWRAAGEIEALTGLFAASPPPLP
jgi:hypothetical protein